MPEAELIATTTMIGLSDKAVRHAGRALDVEVKPDSEGHPGLVQRGRPRQIVALIPHHPHLSTS